MDIPRSIHDKDGVDVGKNRNLAYLYGLSDFFSYVFEDTDKTNLMMEANALMASEVYSNFLQLTSTLTLNGVQTNTGTSIKLLLIKETDRVGVSSVYNLPQALSSAKFASNRPFLPTELLEEGVDFRITQTSTTASQIKFARQIEDYRFSKRIGADGITEYAVWLTDVALDSQLMSKYYGNLLGQKPEVSTEQFSNFIFGLYYLYMNGPTLRVLEQGLNLVLGVPLARDLEEVVDIRNYLETNQYLVITALNQYLLPTGVVPDVRVGDVLLVGAPIAKWIELKDYISHGKWWLGVSIPESIIRFKPLDQTNRSVAQGDHFDRLMSEYLFRNTFLVRINLGSNSESSYLGKVGELVLNSKSAHAQPIYVWRVSFSEDTLGVDDDGFSTALDFTPMRSINWHPIDELAIG